MRTREAEAAAAAAEAQLGMRWDELGWDGVGWSVGDGERTGWMGGCGDADALLDPFYVAANHNNHRFTSPSSPTLPSPSPAPARASAAVVEALGSGPRTDARQLRGCWFTRAGEAGRLGLEER